MTDPTAPAASPLRDATRDWLEFTPAAPTPPADVAGLVADLRHRTFRVHPDEVAAALEAQARKMADLTAENARLSNEAVLKKAECDGIGSLLLDVQRDCIAERKARQEAEAENAELRKASAKSLLETGRDLLVELAEMQARAEKAEADRQTFETACINAVADRREATDELLREREARQKAEAEVECLQEAGTALASYFQLAVNCGWLENFEELTAWIAAMKEEDNGLSD